MNQISAKTNLFDPKLGAEIRKPFARLGSISVSLAVSSQDSLRTLELRTKHVGIHSRSENNCKVNPAMPISSHSDCLQNAQTKWRHHSKYNLSLSEGYPHSIFRNQNITLLPHDQSRGECKITKSSNEASNSFLGSQYCWWKNSQTTTWDGAKIL